MRVYLIAILILFSKVVYCQFQDTIFFDKKWEQTENKKAKYFRLYKVTDSIVEVKDYYKTGEIQMTGTFLYKPQKYSIVESLHKGKEIKTHTWYEKNGNKYHVIIYNPFDIENRQIVKNQKPNEFPDTLKPRISYEIYFYRNGQKKDAGYYVDEIYLHGTWINYNKKSQIIFYTEEYEFDLLNGNKTYYYSDGVKMESIQYKDDKKSGETLKYDWNGIPKTRLIYENGKLQSKEKIN